MPFLVREKHFPCVEEICLVNAIFNLQFNLLPEVPEEAMTLVLANSKRRCSVVQLYTNVMVSHYIKLTSYMEM